MTIPDDLDDLLALVDAKRRSLEEAMDRVQQEQADGRSGYSAYGKARLIEADYRKLAAIALTRVEAALATL